MDASGRKTAVRFLCPALGVVVLGFVGLVLGGGLSGRAREEPAALGAAEWSVSNQSLLREGERVPDLELCALDGSPRHLVPLLEGACALLLFVSTGCEPCQEAVRCWSLEETILPADLRVIGICMGEPENARRYCQETGFPYPMVCDPGYAFVHRYRLGSFPSLVAVSRQGRVVAVLQGYHEGYRLMDAYGLIGGES